MRDREALFARLAADREDRVAARHRAVMLWRDHRARRALRARLDEIGAGGDEEAPSAIATLFATGDMVAPLIADLVAAMAREPFFDPPSAVIRDEVQHGIVLIDHPLALLSLSVSSADAIMARKAKQRGVGSIGMSGSVSVIRFHRAGGAVLRFWSADGPTCRAERARHRCRDGDVIVIDGCSRGYAIESCTSDIVMLRATLKPGRGVLRHEYDARSERLIGLASNDEAASRSQMLLTLLRLCGRRDAAERFRDAIEAEPHFLRWHAMREYLALDGAAALPWLARMAESDPHDEVRDAARATLGAIMARNQQVVPVCHA